MDSIKLTDWKKEFCIVLDGKEYFVVETPTEVNITDEYNDIIDEKIRGKILEMLKEYGEW